MRTFACRGSYATNASAFFKSTLTNWLTLGQVPMKLLAWVQSYIEAPWALLLALNLFLIGVGALVVVSHWFVDLLVHIPDLTLYGTPPKLGFGQLDP